MDSDMINRLNDHDREITLLSKAITRLEAIMESDQEIKRDMRDEMARNREQSERVISAITRIEAIKQDIVDLKQTKESCIKEGCQKAQDAYKIASWTKDWFIRILIGIGSIVGIALLGKVIK